MEHDKTAGLILRARNGDADAFVELMEQNKQSMYKTAKAWLVQEEDDEYSLCKFTKTGY